jgi:putative spermidine/putrescine transport system substrate-binding protein
MWNQNILQTDYWVILKGSKNLAESYEFLKFAGDAKNQARFPNYIPNGMSNKSANANVDPSVLPHLPTNPANMANASPNNVPFWIDNGEKLSDRFDKWVAR